MENDNLDDGSIDECDHESDVDKQNEPLESASSDESSNSDNILTLLD